jgi:uncharacterized protein YerC
MKDDNKEYDKIKNVLKVADLLKQNIDIKTISKETGFGIKQIEIMREIFKK